jgi:hypothetical protein
MAHAVSRPQVLSVFTALIIGCATIAFLYFAISKRQIIHFHPDSIQPESGCAYIAVIDDKPLGWPAVQIVSDDGVFAGASQLSLLEDGRPLGPAHALHGDIRGKGNGRYSHWKRVIYFSSSDCTDPRKNGRRYTALADASIAPITKVIAVFAIFTLFVLLLKWGNFSDRVQRAGNLIDKVSDRILLPHRVNHNFSAVMILFVILLVTAGFLFAWVWLTGASVSLAVAGAFQISDSSNYWLCSNALLDLGNFGPSSTTGEWCQRRSTYPVFLSGITWIAQRNIFLTLLIQALVVLVAIAVFTRRVANYLGIAGALVCAALLFRYASEDLFFLTMTENAGVIFGCTGFSLLLLSTERRSVPMMMLGIALVSIALNARAGALLALPLLLLWAGVVARQNGKNPWQSIVMGGLAMLAGFMLQTSLVLAVGGSPSNSHGNFAYVLYGLSVGGKGWHQVLVDYPGLSGSDATISKEIYSFAWQNIVSQPEMLITGFLKNISYFMDNGTYGFDKLNIFGALAKVFYWLAWIPLFINRKNPAYLLFGLSSVGILISMPFLLGDGGPRVFAATVAVDVFQISLGFAWTLMVLSRRLGAVCQPGVALIQPKSSKASMEMFFSGGLLLIVFVPFFVSSTSSVPVPISSSYNCRNDEYLVITDIGKNGSMVLDFVVEGSPTDFRAGEVQRPAFRAGIPANAWWRDEVLSFGGNSLLLAYQQDRTDPLFPGPYPVYSDDHLAKYHGHVVQLCVDKIETKKVFGVSYRKLNKITVLD